MFLYSCNDPPDEYISICIKSHTETRIMYFPNGSGGIRMQLMPHKVCDERKTVRNPKYDKWLESNKSND